MAEVNQVIHCTSAAICDEHIKKGKDEKKLVVIDFTASWCGPCRTITPILVEVAKKNPNVIFLKADVDELQDVAARFKVEAMPTFVFLKDGEEIDRVVGARKEELLVAIAKHSTEVVAA